MAGIAIPYGDYLPEREKLFADKDITALYNGAQRFNRGKRRRQASLGGDAMVEENSSRGVCAPTTWRHNPLVLVALTTLCLVIWPYDI